MFVCEGFSKLQLRSTMIVICLFTERTRSRSDSRSLKNPDWEGGQYQRQISVDHLLFR